MHPLQILGNPLFMALVKSGLYHIHVTKSAVFIKHESGCYVDFSFSQVSVINSNGVTTTFECGSVWVSLFQQRSMFHIGI